MVDSEARKTSPREDIRIIARMLAALALPTAITLAAVRMPPGTPPSENPTPGGYTISLLLFLIPILAVGFDHIRSPRHEVERKAFLAAVGVVAAVGAVLDLFFGHAFFRFGNPGATLRLDLPAFDWSTFRFVSSYLPVEDFLFYILGGVFVITVYLWADVDWLEDYAPDEFRRAARRVGPIFHVSKIAVVLCLGAIVAGYAYKTVTDPGGGFPGYFTFLVVLGFCPTLILRGTAPFINWRAFSLAYAALILISLMWEVTLGLPYSWWGYRPEAMLGISILAWTDLPVEAVMLWLVAAWGGVGFFEMFRLLFNSDRGFLELLFGKSS